MSSQTVIVMLGVYDSPGVKISFSTNFDYSRSCSFRHVLNPKMRGSESVSEGWKRGRKSCGGV